MACLFGDGLVECFQREFVVLSWDMQFGSTAPNWTVSKPVKHTVILQKQQVNTVCFCTAIKSVKLSKLTIF